ncbi:MAG: archaeal proteasome endopeptidase complex subunit beta [Nanoarchaeota archaeon]|nr:archaeal proteasome endopeptidase complex subunit beta [Nanoarchaeota archaeon]
MEGISKDEMKHGTTTVGIVTKEGVVVAADKRATMGYLVAHKNVDKVVEITDRILMTTAGMVGDAQMLAKYLKAELELYEIRKNKKITVKAASTLLANILYSNRFSIPFYVQLLLAGVDETGYHLYSLGPDGSNLEDKYISTGSGSVMAYGVLEDNYKDGISLKEGIHIAARAIKAAMARDIATGEGIDVYTITKKGISKVPKEEIQKIVSK